MEKTPVKTATREEIISDLESRLKSLRKEDHAYGPGFLLLQKAAKIERHVLEAKSRDVSDYFFTAYAGRRVILWDYMDGQWKGKLCNRESGITKKQSSGNSAEEMLRGLMPTK
ncbi:MAG TPA: hypothetical protein VKC54_02805 [Patescibacteria group bacterium]|nr:hypothetical protein [Patescibacteria group bacterium]